MEILSLKAESFGLDISDFSLKIIKLKKKRRGLGLVSFGEKKVPPGIIENGEIKNEDVLVKLIKEAVSEVKGNKIKIKNVICSLPEEKSFFKVIQMPLLREEELKKAVRYEAENYIPLPLEKVYLDSQLIYPMVDSLDHSDVMLIAFPREIIDSYISCLKKAKLQPIVFELESSAIVRSLVKNEASPYPLLLVDIGDERTIFTIFSGYSLRFTTSIKVSSKEFTKAIIEKLKVDEEKAEKLKLKYGLEKKVTKGKEVFEALAPSLTDLVGQIKKYMSFYKTHASHEHLSKKNEGVQRILLCGGGANLKNIAKFLTNELNIPVELGNPWVNILPASKKETPQLPYSESLRYTTAIGLALRAIKEKHD